MSMYNMINGVNPATFLILPLLSTKHPDEYPRFRDCFVENGEIHVLTRCGGGNRGQGYGEHWLINHPSYLRDRDEEFDSTYATFAFSVPEEWRADFDKIMNGDLKNASEEYKQRVLKTYPTIKEKLSEMLY